jgi:hypothetical protein
MVSEHCTRSPRTALIPSIAMRSLIAIALALLSVSPAHADKKDKKSKKVKVSGYVQVFYRFRIDTNDDGFTESSLFRIQRARVKVSGKINKRVGYNIEVDPRAPEVTGILRDAYIQLKVIPHHKLRVGQQKTQFGYENRESSTRLYTVNRSELGEGLGRGLTLRDIGIGIIGGWPIHGNLELEDALTLVNGAGMNVQYDPTGRKNLWGRAGVHWWCDARHLDVRFGLSGGIGNQVEPADTTVTPPEPAFRFEFQRLGADLEVDSPWAFAAAELAMGWDQIEGDPEGNDSWGWYILAAGKVRWHAGPVLRYESVDGFTRLTAGAYQGDPDAQLRFMTSYEVWKEEDYKHDDRVYLWMQAKF